jgi:hypothetical protein
VRSAEVPIPESRGGTRLRSVDNSQATGSGWPPDRHDAPVARRTLGRRPAVQSVMDGRKSVAGEGLTCRQTVNSRSQIAGQRPCAVREIGPQSLSQLRTKFDSEFCRKLCKGAV